MKEFETVVLEDNLKYIILEEKIINNTIYVLLSNINDDKDICFRKVIKKENGDYFIGLDDEKEVKEVIIHFSKDILNENK